MGSFRAIPSIIGLKNERNFATLQPSGGYKAGKTHEAQLVFKWVLRVSFEDQP